MKQHFFPHSLYLSFFSSALYREVLTGWKGTGLLHLLSVALCAVFLCYFILSSHIYSFTQQDNVDKLYTDITSAIAGDKDFIVEEQIDRLLTILSAFPNAKIENQILVTENNKSTEILDPHNHNHSLTINPSPQYDTNTSAVGAFILHDRFELRSKGGKNHTTYYKDLSEIEINQINAALSYLHHFPTLSFSDHRLSMVEESPYIMSYADQSNAPFIAFDMTHDVTPQTSQYPNAQALVTSSHIYIRHSPFYGKAAADTQNWHALPLTELNNDAFYRDFHFAIPEVAKYTTNFILPDNAVTLLMLFCAVAIALNFTFTLFSLLILQHFIGTNTSYGNVFRLCSVACTPMILCSPIFLFLQLHYPSAMIAPNLSLLLIGIGYTLFATLSQKKFGQ